MKFSFDDEAETYGVKVATTEAMTIDADVDFYIGDSNGNSTVAAAANNKDIIMALDLADKGSDTNGSTYINVNNLSAANSTGAVQLYGNANNNVLEGGQGESTLWGGLRGGNDTLIGGAGADTFYFGTGNGKDIISDAGATDKVMLYDVSAEYIGAGALTAYGESGVRLTLTTGDRLTIDDVNDSLTFQLADGSTYTGKQVKQYAGSGN